LTRTVRFFLLLSACAVALAFGGNALAAYNPSLLVAGTSHALGSGGPVVIGIGQDINDDATAAIRIYAPLGYEVTLGQAPGTRLGAVEAQVKLPIAGGTRAPFEGTVRTDNPANYLNNPCTRNPAPHQAVWVLDGTIAGTPIRIPMYVDRITAGAEAAFASARIVICLPSPYIPPAQGGAQSGASLIVAAFSVSGVFSNPNTRGSYPWQALFVPYTVGTGAPNPGNAAQSTSITRLPVQLAVTAKKQKRGARWFARVTVCLNEAGRAVRGARINILGGRTARKTSRMARGSTNTRGCVTRTVRMRYRTMFFRASTTVPDRDVTSQGCTPPLSAAPGLPPARCTGVTLAPAFNIFSRNSFRLRR